MSKELITFLLGLALGITLMTVVVFLGNNSGCGCAVSTATPVYTSSIFPTSTGTPTPTNIPASPTMTAFPTLEPYP